MEAEDKQALGGCCERNQVAEKSWPRERRLGRCYFADTQKPRHADAHSRQFVFHPFENPFLDPRVIAEARPGSINDIDLKSRFDAIMW